MFDPFEGILDQNHITDYLRAALASGQVTHAYLIAGVKECGAQEIARRFAAAIIAAGDDGEYECALRGSHPDLHVLRPQSAQGYLVEQVREVVHDAGLAPVRAKQKVYIVQGADAMMGAPANAFLKTLEEPPADVCIIMLANNEQAVLQTIRSRCQVLVCAAATTRAQSSYELEEMIAHVAQGADNRTVLAYAKRFVELSAKGVDELKDAQAEEEAASSDYLAAGARKALAEKHKREVTMKQRSALLEGLATFRSWLRDCMLSTQDAQELALSASATTTAGVSGIIGAFKALDAAEVRIAHNVTPQLAIEACLLEIRGALCQK